MINKLCACGCGQQVSNIKNKFLQGHNSRCDYVKEKKRQLSLLHYGVENPFQSKEVQEKYKQTCLNNHGVENPMQSKETKEKSKRTCVLKYGVEHPTQSDEIQNKITQTHMLKYGVEHPSQTKEFQDKYKQTCLEKYGVENPRQSLIIQDKYKHTCLLKFGVDNFAKTQQGRQYSRVNSIRMVENQKLNGEPLSPKIGDNERPFLDELQKYTSYTILRQISVIGYFPDGCISELNLFIQFDERVHFLNKECTIYKLCDIQCTLNLASLGYIVFRVSEVDWKKKRNEIIDQFRILISNM